MSRENSNRSGILEAASPSGGLPRPGASCQSLLGTSSGTSVCSVPWVKSLSPPVLGGEASPSVGGKASPSVWQGEREGCDNCVHVQPIALIACKRIYGQRVTRQRLLCGRTLLSSEHRRRFMSLLTFVEVAGYMGGPAGNPSIHIFFLLAETQINLYAVSLKRQGFRVSTGWWLARAGGRGCRPYS